MKPNFSNFQIDLNKFKFSDEIGHGTTATVYLVENINDGRIYALKKVCYSDSIEVHREKTLITREISIMMRLRHPCIVQFYGFNLEQKDHNLKAYILLQYAKNGSFDNILNKIRSGKIKDFNPTTMQKIIIGIARAMMYLHENHIIHRDLKPSNVLLDANYIPLLTDFGYAKDISNNGLDATMGVGTPIYEAPEVISSNVYDEKADVYSFGIMLYEIFTNCLPYIEIIKRKRAQESFFKKITNGYRPQFPESFNNEKIKKLIEKCWSSNPSERPTFENLFEILAYDTDFEEKEKKEETKEETDKKEGTAKKDDKGETKETDKKEETSKKEEEEEEEEVEMKEFVAIKRALFKPENDGKEKGSCYLDNVDQEELINFANYLKERENYSMLSLWHVIDELKQQILTMKQENELAFNQLRTEMKNEIRSQFQKFREDSLLAQQQEKFFIKCLVYKESNPKFNGILKFLTNKAGSNLHDSKTVSITTNSMHSDDSHFIFFFKDENHYHPKNLVDFDKDNEYKSNDTGGAIVCFDFMERLVQINKYEIRRGSNQAETPNLKNWVIEMSKDGVSWEVTDRRSNDISLNSAEDVVALDVNNPLKEFYRYIRIRQTGISWYSSYNCNVISLSAIDFYGKIKEPKV